MNSQSEVCKKDRVLRPGGGLDVLRPRRLLRKEGLAVDVVTHRDLLFLLPICAAMQRYRMRGGSIGLHCLSAKLNICMQTRSIIQDGNAILVSTALL